MAIKTYFYWLCLLGFAAWWMISPAQPALACTPTVTPSGFQGYSLPDYINTADVIVEGTITDIIRYQDTPPNPLSFGDDAAFVDVHQYLKGNGSAIIHIGGFGESTACLIEASVGYPRIFYVTTDIYGGYWIFRQEVVSQNVLAQIQQAVGQLPSTPLAGTSIPSTETALSVTSTNNNVWIQLLGLGVLAIVLSLIVVWSTKRTKRAPQP